MRKFIIFFLLVAIAFPAAAQDTVIIGNTPEKQAETQQRWGQSMQPMQQSQQSNSILAGY